MLHPLRRPPVQPANIVHVWWRLGRRQEEEEQERHPRGVDERLAPFPDVFTLGLECISCCDIGVTCSRVLYNYNFGTGRANAVAADDAIDKL